METFQTIPKWTQPHKNSEQIPPSRIGAAFGYKVGTHVAAMPTAPLPQPDHAHPGQGPQINNNGV